MKPMTIDELCEVIRLASSEHNPFVNHENTKHITCIKPKFDTISNSCVEIVFDIFNDDSVKFVVKDDIKHVSLYDVVIGWLRTPREKRSGVERRKKNSKDYKGKERRISERRFSQNIIENFA